MRIGGKGNASPAQRVGLPAEAEAPRVVPSAPAPEAAPVSILDGDVTGDAAQNVVAKIQGVTAPAAGSGDDGKFVRYDDASASFVMTAPSVTLSGDVTGGSGANMVGRVQGVPLNAPVAGDNGKYAKYNHGTGEIVWDAPSGGGSSPTAVLIGAVDDISTTGTSYVQMDQPGEATGHPYGWTPFRSGQIVGMSVDLTSNVGTAPGDAYTVDIHLDSGGGYMITGCAVQVDYMYDRGYLDLSGSPVSFAAGNRIAAFHEHFGVVNVVAGVVTLYVQF